MLLLPVALAVALVGASVDAQSYAPTYVSCPTTTPLVRQAGTPATRNQTLSPEELAYTKNRRQNVAPGAYST